MPIGRFIMAAGVGVAWLITPAAGQDVSPLRRCHVWLPMTGMTDGQMRQARAAGYDTLLLKVAPPLTGAGVIEFGPVDRTIQHAESHGFKVILAILGWGGLGHGRYWDTDESGAKIADRLDPFWPEAMAAVERYFAAAIRRYRSGGRVVAFAPTWGIYGEAGFTSWTAGRSPHALARFNEWRKAQGLPGVNKLPTRQGGPNTEFNRFIRFRYVYVEEQFDAMVRRLKTLADPLPVGMWQELYPVAGYLWNMVEVPSADFALYESCFPFQTTHHPEKCLAETMGFRYRCRSAAEYRDYYLPLLARKRGEGQRFMGCQLSNDYVKNYGWPVEKAERIGFDRWEDEFSPHLRRLLDAPLESPKRDVLLVFPTYAAAALSDQPQHDCDVKLIDVLLRMYGCQMVRYGMPRFDKLDAAEMNRFRLIVVPCAAYLLPGPYEELRRTTATVLFTGGFGQSLDGQHTPFGGTREIDGATLRYVNRPAGEVRVVVEHPIAKGLARPSGAPPVRLPADESFEYVTAGAGTRILAECGGSPVLSVGREGRFVFVHGHLFAGLCHDPERKPPQELSGSQDASANEVDTWGPYSSSHPQNVFGMAVMKAILDHAGVDYRVPDPRPRTTVRYLGDHMEQASVSANIAYNNTGTEQRLTVRLPYPPRGVRSEQVGGRWRADVAIPAFSYVVMEPERSGKP